MNINISAVFCQSLISSHCVCFNLWQGVLAISSLVGSSVGHYIHFNLQQSVLAAGSSVGSSVSSLVGFSVSSWVGSSVSSLVSSSSASSLGSSGLSYRYGFTAIVLKSVGLLGSYTLHISLLILSSLNRPVYLPLCLILPSRYISTSKLRGRLQIIVMDGLFCWFSILLTCFFALILTISSIAFFMAAAYCVVDSASGLSLLI